MLLTAPSALTRDNTLASLAEPVATQLAATEGRLATLVPEGVGGLMPTVYQHALRAGGKRLRPLLSLLSCKAAGGDPDDCVNLAMAVEALHLSSLIHDDVIDEATERRGHPSVRQQMGNRASILVGDFLVAEVFRRLAGELGRQALGELANSVSEMCLAELADQPEDPRDLTETLYFNNIRGKTASLIATSCAIGAIAANAPARREPLAAYGLALGQAFQIVDDLLDLYGEEAALGKPVLQDLLRGHWTLPLIHALQTGTSADAEQLRQLMLQANGNPSVAREAADLADRLGGRLYAEQRAQELLQEAKQALSNLPLSEARQSLLGLADYVVQRQY